MATTRVLELLDLPSSRQMLATGMSGRWYDYVANGVSALFLVGLPIGALIYALLPTRRGPGAARFDGPTLTGTAQVLSVARAGGLVGILAAGRSRNVRCKIALKVEVPGRPPYDATVTAFVGSGILVELCVDGQRWEPGRPWHVKPETTVAVEVDPAHPEQVRIDFTHMTHQPGPDSPPAQRRSWFDYSDMAPRYRVLMVAWWVVSVGGIIVVLTRLMMR